MKLLGHMFAMIVIACIMGWCIKFAFDSEYLSAFGFGGMFAMCWSMFRDLIKLWADLK